MFYEQVVINLHEMGGMVRGWYLEAEELREDSSKGRRCL
jgi:hypothetical protein